MRGLHMKEANRIDAVIFDLDGVIVDTARYHYLAWKRIAGSLGYDLPAGLNEQLKGVGRAESLDLILAAGNIRLNAGEKKELADRKNSLYLEYISGIKTDELIPCAKELVLLFRKKGKKTALGSSSRNAAKILEKLEITNLFDCIVDGNQIERTKPYPEIFLTAARNLGVSPENCVVIEDAAAGVQAAINGGMKVVGIGKGSDLYQADAVVRSISDLFYLYT